MNIFDNITNTVKGVMQDMGLINTIRKLEDVRDIPLNNDWYARISDWNSLYAGHLDSIHNVTSTSIAGTKTRSMLSLNMPKAMAEEMAKLIFNEDSRITVDNEQLNEYLENVFRSNRFTKNFREHLERMFSLGGMAIKPYYDTALDKISISFYTADNFIPLSWDNRKITEAMFIAKSREGKDRYTHIEIHKWTPNHDYSITHRLFVSDEHTVGELGKEIPINTLYEDLQEKVEMRNIYEPLFVYVKPAIANNLDADNPLGISIYANAMDTLKSLDTAFDSYNREFRLGKRRIIVPASAIRNVIDPNDGSMRRYFDINDEAYEAMDMGIDNNKITDNTVELRVNEHVSAIDSLLNMLSMQCGFSGGTFTFNDASVKTATEVISENSKTYKSKISHESSVKDGLEHLIHAIVTLAQLFDDSMPAVEDYEVATKFNDVIAEDKGAQIERTMKLVAAKLMPKVLALQEVHGITEDEARSMLEDIIQEDRMVLQSSIDTMGLNERILPHDTDTATDDIT